MEPLNIIEKTKCVCGSHVQYWNLSRHRKTKKHLKFINNL